jgi:hypothetical protein
VTDWVSLRELDERLGLAKGSAFRAFKRAGLAEGPDFRVLDATRDAAEIARLRAAGRIWRASVNVVLLSRAAAARLEAVLRARA